MRRTLRGKWLFQESFNKKLCICTEKVIYWNITIKSKTLAFMDIHAHWMLEAIYLHINIHLCRQNEGAKTLQGCKKKKKTEINCKFCKWWMKKKKKYKALSPSKCGSIWKPGKHSKKSICEFANNTKFKNNMNNFLELNIKKNFFFFFLLNTPQAKSIHNLPVDLLSSFSETAPQLIVSRDSLDVNILSPNLKESKSNVYTYSKTR